MRKVQKWRYYCDHCKKAGGSSFHMARHERGCTANPNRVCGVCYRMGFSAAPLSELIAWAKQASKPEHSPIIDRDWLSLDEEGFKALHEKADGCPCCILAALRQSGAEVSRDVFEFKKALSEAWNVHNSAEEENRPAYYGGSYYV